MRILVWDVHGGYTDALLNVPYEFWYCRDDRGDGGSGFGALSASGLARRRVDRPPNAVEVSVEQLRDEPPDVVLGQRLEEVQVAHELLRRRPGRDLGAVFLEHNTPKGGVPDTRHPLADRSDWQLVHVTHFNALFWDSGSTTTRVIEHGLPDPGHRYSGERESLAFVVNEPIRRWRTTGTDLLPCFTKSTVDAFGIDGELLPAVLGDRCPDLRFAGNLASAELDAALAQRRAYLHLTRWTSLGLSLINAMLLGMPVVALGTTEAFRAVPPGGGVCSTDVEDLVTVAEQLLRDPERARTCGDVARRHALDRFALPRFIAQWQECLESAVL